MDKQQQKEKENIQDTNQSQQEVEIQDNITSPKASITKPNIKDTKSLSYKFKLIFPNSRAGFIRKAHLQASILFLICSIFSFTIMDDLQIAEIIQEQNIPFLIVSVLIIILGYLLFERSKFDEFSGRRIIAKSLQILGYALLFSLISANYGYGKYRDDFFSFLVQIDLTSLTLLTYSIIRSIVYKLDSMICAVIAQTVFTIICSLLYQETIMDIVILGVTVLTIKLADIMYVHSNFAYGRYKEQMRKINQKKLERSWHLTGQED